MVAKHQKSFSQGFATVAKGQKSFLRGFVTVAKGQKSFSRGFVTVANGQKSFSRGFVTVAKGQKSFLRGFVTVAKHQKSFLRGFVTIAKRREKNISLIAVSLSHPLFVVTQTFATFALIELKGESMRAYVDPMMVNFLGYVNAIVYVDKSGMLDVTNRLINTKESYVCMARPRRFGKSLAAEMLNAYYNISLDTKELFSHYDIANFDSFEKHLNKYHVIKFDINSEYPMLKLVGEENNIVQHIQKSVVEELVEVFGDIAKCKTNTISESVRNINKETGIKFIFIIDEWDCLFREEKSNSKLLTEYINFLRSLFKGNEAERCVALAYMTGILPIKKIEGESALNNFWDCTLVKPLDFAPYMGFTERDMDALCEEYGMDRDGMRYWYDGYKCGAEHIYNPRSVVEALRSKEFGSYWSSTGIYKSISSYIRFNYDGLQDAIARMLSGGKEVVDITTFSNDLNEVNSKDDVLTVLVYLGYLSYDSSDGTVFITNEEVKHEFVKAVKDVKWDNIVRVLDKSRHLLGSVINMDSEAVAEMLDEVHINEVPGLRYSEENALYNVISIAFFYTRNFYYHHYEMPAGRGFADIVYTPMPGKEAKYPPLIIELKYNKCALGALNQIKEKQYPQLLHKLGLQGKRCLLVGINYDDDKRHICEIEEVVIG